MLLQSQEDPDVKTKRRKYNCRHQLKGGLDCEIKYRNHDWTKNELKEMDRIEKTPKLLTIYRSTLGRSYNRLYVTRKEAGGKRTLKQ